MLERAARGRCSWALVGGEAYAAKTGRRAIWVGSLEQLRKARMSSFGRSSVITGSSRSCSSGVPSAARRAYGWAWRSAPPAPPCRADDGAAPRAPVERRCENSAWQQPANLMLCSGRVQELDERRRTSCQRWPSPWALHAVSVSPAHPHPSQGFPVVVLLMTLASGCCLQVVQGRPQLARDWRDQRDKQRRSKGAEADKGNTQEYTCVFIH